MDDIGNARDEAKAERIDVDLGASTTHAVEDKWCDGKAGDGVTVAIWRERIGVADQVDLIERRHRPNGYAGEAGGVSWGEAPGEPGADRDRGTAYRVAARVAVAAGDGPASAAKFSAAVADFSKEIELAPKDPIGYMERGQTELGQIQFDAAIADLNKALELKGDEALCYKFRGFAYAGLRQWDKAVADFTVAIQKNPNDQQNYDQRALAYRSLSNFPAAIQDYTTAIEKNPNYQPEYARRGYTYALAEQYEKAIADYQQALKMDPNDQETPERLKYAQGRLAAKNAPTPTPTPTPGTSFFTPAKIFFAVVILVIIAVVVRLVTRGKPEEISSSRIR